jgi:hypothetical protein
LNIYDAAVTIIHKKTPLYGGAFQQLVLGKQLFWSNSNRLQAVKLKKNTAFFTKRP